MKVAWKQLAKKNADKEEDIKHAWSDSENFREFLIELLEDRIKATENEAVRDDYDCPNWNLKQADMIGCIRTYKEVIALLDK